MKARYRTLLAGLLAVAIAFGVALPLGFQLRPRFRAIPDDLFGAIVAFTLAGIAFGVMRLVNGPLWPPSKSQSDPLRRPDPDMDAGPPTGYELSFEDFRSLVTDPSSQAAVAPLLKDWYRYEIAGQGPDTSVRSEDGRVVGLRLLHNRIQLDPSKQYTVYQRAMDLWR